MTTAKPPTFVTAASVAPRAVPSIYPEIFAPRVDGRTKRQLGNAFGLVNFGVNLTSLEPGAETALRHSHSLQDEFVYVLEGSPTLITDDGAFALQPGDCTGFRAGTGNAHHLRNDTQQLVTLLEVGDRSKGCIPTYPDDDLAASLDPTGGYRFTHKDGGEY